MSMNFYISGVREITVNKTGVVETQHCNYQPWQTPTVITRELLKQADPVAAYKAWVMSNAVDRQEPVYAEDDYLCDNEPVGFKTVNAGQEECQQVDDWIAAVTAQGYELEFYTL